MQQPKHKRIRWTNPQKSFAMRMDKRYGLMGIRSCMHRKYGEFPSEDLLRKWKRQAKADPKCFAASSKRGRPPMEDVDRIARKRTQTANAYAPFRKHYNELMRLEGNRRVLPDTFDAFDEKAEAKEMAEPQEEVG